MSFNNKVPLEFIGTLTEMQAAGNRNTPEYSLFYRLDVKKVYYLKYVGDTSVSWIEVGVSPE